MNHASTSLPAAETAVSNAFVTSKRVQIYLLFLQTFRWPKSMPKPLASISCTFGSLWQAIWLGLLDSEELNQVTRDYYMGRSGFEKEDFNIHQGLWSWEASALQKLFIGQKRILLAGAGGGREVIALARLGFEVTAFDFSPYLTTACIRNLDKAGYTARVLDAPPDSVPDGLELYDALWIGRGFYHHIPGRARRISFLKECRLALKSEAPIILSDFFTRSSYSGFYYRTQAIANICRRLELKSEKIELGDGLTNCFQHAFTPEEIEQEFLSGGLHLDSFVATPFGADSHLAHAVAHCL